MSDATVTGSTDDGAGATPDPEDHAAPEAYTVLGELGRGGMGRVLRARDERLGREVAIKKLLGTGLGAHLRFEREARITARLQHPAIVPIYEVSTLPSGDPYYAMKLVSGETLAAKILAAPGFSARLALLRHVVVAAEAIAYAHSRGVIHRDLKASNVVVGEFGETVVIDWGLAKHVGEDDALAPAAGPWRSGSAELTEAGAVLGTPAYMAPEQVQGDTVDARADVYSLGAMLYHLLAGVMPYQGGSSREVLARVLDGPPRPLAARVPEVPRDLAAIVARAMARDRAARYPTARELATDLTRFETGQLVASHDYGAGELLARWVRRHRAAVAVGAIAVAAATVGATIAVGRIVAARDRAARAQQAAEYERDQAIEARASAVRSADGAILASARMLAEDDPRAALEQLRGISPGSWAWPAARVVAADAIAAGVQVPVTSVGTDLDHLALEDDGTIVATGRDRIVRVDPRGATTSTPRAEPWQPPRVPLPGATTDVVRSADGRWLAATRAAGAPAVHVWDLRSGRRHELAGHAIAPSVLVFAPDGRYLVTAGADATVRVWDLRHVEVDAVAATYAAGGAVADVVVDAARGELITLTRGGVIARWPAPALDSRAVPGRTVLSPDQRWLAHVREDRVEVETLERGPVRSVDLREPGGALRPWHPAPVFAAGAPVLVAATTRELIRWDLAEDRRERVRVPADIWAIGVAPDGETLAALDTDDRLYLLAGDRVRLLLERGATTPSFSGDGAHLASCDADGGARVFRVADGAPLAIPEAEVCAFSPDGARLVLGARDGDAWSCALPDARCTRLDGGRGATLLAAGDDGRVVAALHGGAIVTWDDAGAPRRDLGRHRAEVTLLALSPDGRSLASGGSGPEVHLWDLASGQGRRLRGALAQPTALAFAGDRVRVVDWYAIHELRDDLPRDEPGLRAAIDRALQSGQ